MMLKLTVTVTPSNHCETLYEQQDIRKHFYEVRRPGLYELGRILELQDLKARGQNPGTCHISRF